MFLLTLDNFFPPVADNQQDGLSDMFGLCLEYMNWKLNFWALKVNLGS